MKSITDATWKDAAIIEARTLVARLEGISGQCMANPQAMLTAPVKQVELERATRQAAKLADLIERIDERPVRRPSRSRESEDDVIVKGLAVLHEIAAALQQFGQLRVVPTLDEHAHTLTLCVEADSVEQEFTRMELFSQLQYVLDVAQLRALATRYGIDPAVLERAINDREEQT